MTAAVTSTVTAPLEKQFPIPGPPTQEYRASKLLRRGAMPLFPPALRLWDKEEIVSLPVGEHRVAWPPVDWKSLSPDQKTLQVEFLAMRILVARGQDVSKIDRCELLDNFNFLVLPGSLRPQHVKHDLRLKSCSATYHQLRVIATGKVKNTMWLTMIESSAIHRDISNDSLLKICDQVPLRL